MPFSGCSGLCLRHIEYSKNRMSNVSIHLNPSGCFWVRKFAWTLPALVVFHRSYDSRRLQSTAYGIFTLIVYYVWNTDTATLPECLWPLFDRFSPSIYSTASTANLQAQRLVNPAFLYIYFLAATRQSRQWGHIPWVFLSPCKSSHRTQ
jgi:hypothetical protein